MFFDGPRWVLLICLLGSVLFCSFEAVPVAVDPPPARRSAMAKKQATRFKKRLKNTRRRLKKTAQPQARLVFNLLCGLSALLMVGSIVLSILGAVGTFGMGWLLLFLGNLLVDLFCGVGLMTLFIFPGPNFWRGLLFFTALWGAVKLLTWGFVLGIPGLWIAGLMLTVVFLFSIIGLARAEPSPPSIAESK